MNSAGMKVVLYKGSFPARYGERLSSVVDIRTKDGDAYKYHGNISIGAIASKLNLEGPVGSDKTTFSVSGRRTYFDLFTAPLSKLVSDGNSSLGYYFYDINAKVNHKFSDRDRLYASFYMGKDGIYLNQQTTNSKTKINMKWGNIIASLRWNHIINNKLFMNITAAFSQYRFNTKLTDSDSTSQSAIVYYSGITDGVLKADIDFNISPKNNMKFGAMYILHRFMPEVIAARGEHVTDGDISLYNKPIVNNEIAAYIEDNVTLNNWLKLNGGLRYSAFAVPNKFYHSLQPRLSARALITDNISVKLGYSYMSQYIHLLTNSALNMPNDLWVPSTENIAPQKTHQVALGAFYNLLNILDFSIEGYYKTMDNTIEYKDGASFFGVSTDWQDKVNMGMGWAYGIELMVQKNVGKLTGWIGYTWAKSMRKFDRYGQEINFGNPFPAKFDRRHDIKITIAYKASEKIDFAASWLFASGNATTLAAGFERVIVPRERSAVLGGTVAKSSAGALSHLSICRVKNIAETLQCLKERGYWIFGAVADPYAAPIYATNFPAACCLVIGGEGRGIRPLVQKRCDQLFTIPMARGFDSLNVSAAAAVILFELARRRSAAQEPAFAGHDR